eukprot:172240-Amphidinium_carterae.1
MSACTVNCRTEESIENITSSLYAIARRNGAKQFQVTWFVVLFSTAVHVSSSCASLRTHVRNSILDYI